MGGGAGKRTEGTGEAGPGAFDARAAGERKTADDVCTALAAFLAEEAGRTGRRVVAGLAGAPGGGKSTMARHVRERANEALASRDGCVVLPMDGFHYPRSKLDAMANPQVAHARRGAHWTFDAEAFADAVADVAAAAERNEDVRVPSFDHGKGDPVDGDIVVPAHASVVLVEGLYLFLTDDARIAVGEADEEGGMDARVSEAWARAAAHMHHKLFIDADARSCLKRVRKRHIAAWGPDSGNAVSRTIEEIDERIANNDARNATLVFETRRAPGVVLLPGNLPLQRP